MNRHDAFEMICRAVDTISPGSGGDIVETTDLSKGVLDSLDLMNFVFQLEQFRGAKIEAITEEYDDFRVGSLVNLLCEDEGE